MNDIKKIVPIFFFLPALLFQVLPGYSQNQNRMEDIVRISDEGLLVWESDGLEASFFGVNYSSPFAYGYRALNRKQINIEESITADVYHMARLGFSAFRVHVWDTEISDVKGNLLENEHLRLFDFLLAELKKRNIKAIITPIAFWGNGYPEPNYETPGFSHYYGRSRLTTDQEAIKAQENYLKQFLNHVNPYTGIAYKDDPAIIAVEINNEPAHSGSAEGVTSYINSLYHAVKEAGFIKPIFYNIAQNPSYADAVARSKADGFSFQWYPSGLVSGRTLKENYLHHVNAYTIPFDSIPEFSGKPLMVYEFDAADIMGPYMYPAMARSFREAGFQWATQFAYDPMHIANDNTEYQTHYLNLLYTPAKAISMMIAAKVFTQTGIRESFGDYPDNNKFGNASVSFEENSSEWISDEEFIYTGHTQSVAPKPEQLKKIAGTGSSHLVRYHGSGAYFLDKLGSGAWRLEVYPDAILIRDPFARTSPERDVAVLKWDTHQMQLSIEELKQDFQVLPLNEGNSFSTEVEGGRFNIKPGTYLLLAQGENFEFEENTKIGNIGIKEFKAMDPDFQKVYVFHEAPIEVLDSRDLDIKAIVFSNDPMEVVLEYRNGQGRKMETKMEHDDGYKYVAMVNKDQFPSGIFEYRIKVETANDTLIYPGAISKDDLEWYSEIPEPYRVFVSSEAAEVLLFDPAHHKGIQYHPNYDPGFATALSAGQRTGDLLLGLQVKNPSKNDLIAVQHSIKESLDNRAPVASGFAKIILEAKVEGKESKTIEIGLTDSEGRAYVAEVNLSGELEKHEVSLDDLKETKAVLLPRPYPGFMPLYTKARISGGSLNWDNIEKLQIKFDQTEGEMESNGAYQIKIGKIWIQPD
ncbi:membrane or secreted protein [Arthrospiribacter ruber]|uniref:Membrane or secreted protein n=1 Tax=Arthrospiribacter ruber TaxID=2487934 RepID=A0A951IZV1_9BACT|nr:membrane or secreted protein [Arthrospiribacter ruber]MBW3469369.1 membrane or secreted protein [Arthrospiribacter ruber]